MHRKFCKTLCCEPHSVLRKYVNSQYLTPRTKPAHYFLPTPPHKAIVTHSIHSSLLCIGKELTLVHEEVQNVTLTSNPVCLEGCMKKVGKDKLLTDHRGPRLLKRKSRGLAAPYSVGYREQQRSQGRSLVCLELQFRKINLTSLYKMD